MKTSVQSDAGNELHAFHDKGRRDIMPPHKEGTGMSVRSNQRTIQFSHRRVTAFMVAVAAAALGPRASAQDPDLEPGFPVQTFHTAGSYHAGPAIHTLVGNIDADPNLEIIVTSLAGGRLYAFKSNGSTVSGWPIVQSAGAGYIALGK